MTQRIQFDEPDRTDCGTRARLAVSVGIFVATYVALYFGYLQIPDDFLDDRVYYLGITAPCVALIHLIAPGDAVRAVGAHIVGGVNSLGIVRGCDGVAVLLLLVAAIVAMRSPWRQLIRGILGAMTFVYAINQARILTLYFVIERHPQWFTPLHAYVFPTLFVLLAAAFFSFWTASTYEPARAR